MTRIERLVRSRFLRFAVVGGAGFAVNEVALICVMRIAHLDKYTAWFAAFMVAVTFTWWGNRTLTFRDTAAGNRLLAEWATFVAANSLGAAANFATYFVFVTFLPWPFADPVFAVAIGTLVGLVFNYTASKHFVFRDRSAKSR